VGHGEAGAETVSSGEKARAGLIRRATHSGKRVGWSPERASDATTWRYEGATRR
jgi:hypothetical protein